MADAGLKTASLATLDATLTVAGGASGNSDSGDIGANTAAQPTDVTFQISVTQTGTTDTFSGSAKVQWSDDDTNWPDNDQGDVIFSWTAGSAGADLTRSQIISVPVAARYYRLRCTNDNGTDSVDFGIESALLIYQS